jgi:hypothetical protein
MVRGSLSPDQGRNFGTLARAGFRHKRRDFTQPASDVGTPSLRVLVLVLVLVPVLVDSCPRALVAHNWRAARPANDMPLPPQDT